MPKEIEAGVIAENKAESPASPRLRELLRTLKFTLFSAGAGLIQVGVTFLATLIFRDAYWPSYLLGLIASVIWNFTLNRRFTFHSAANVPKAMGLVALFYAVFTPLSTWGVNALTGAGVNEILTQALAMLSNFVLEYLYDRFVVFGSSIDTAVKKK